MKPRTDKRTRLLEQTETAARLNAFMTDPFIADWFADRERDQLAILVSAAAIDDQHLRRAATTLGILRDLQSAIRHGIHDGARAQEELST